MDGGPRYNSHMAYPDGRLTGNCPIGFDTRTMAMMYETIYDVHQLSGEDGEFVLGNGDPTGK